MTDSKQLQYAQRQQSKAAEVGEIPKPKNAKVRAKYEKDLPGFLRHYMPDKFSRPFSDDQKEAMSKIEQAMIYGGLFAEAMPRGTGKTTIVEGAIVWATMYAHRKFPVVIGSDQRAADSIIKDIKIELETNDRLADDFPEVCLPIRHIDGRGQKCATQTVEGVRTRIEWKAGKLVFPHIAGYKTSGITIEGRGLTSGVRGMKSGDLRPDFVLLDDPQTRESANSVSQTNTRVDIILGDVMGLAGHDKRISAVMPCTVINRGDLADSFLDREKNPEWQGHRTPLVYSWSDSETHWENYHEIWQAEQREGRGIEAATKYYIDNRESMDQGAKVTCDHLYDKDTEASAIQHAYNLLYSVKEYAFAAEYQNDPKAASETIYEITPDIVKSNLNGLARYEAPENAHKITGFADINFIGLHWCLTAWSNDFTGFVLTHGKHPGNKKVLYNPKTGENREQKIYEGLTHFFDKLKTVEIRRQGESDPAGIDLFMIDCGAGWMQTVFDWIKFNGKNYPFRIIASRGRGEGQYRQSGVIGTPGDNFHMTKFKGKGQVIAHNADYWRMKTQKAFLVGAGASGSVSLWGDDKNEHAEFADQICGEILIDYAETQKGPLYKWTNKPGSRNDLLDAMVGCAVGAAVCGISSLPKPKQKKRKTKKRPRISYS